jgi:hypothetical protein
MSVRIGESDGCIFVDLADASHRAIRITAEGWSIIADPPVMFRRAPGMLPLPEPRHGGSINDLRRFLNFREPSEDFELSVGWVLAALRPRGPHPLLRLGGEQGSAKSTVTRVLRGLVDPNSVPLRSLPHGASDLAIAASNAHVIAFDNVSILPDRTSDELARLATGSGHGTRRLYTNHRESLFEATRPIILNGIDDSVTRSDLSERTIVITQPPIRPENRQTEREFWHSFNHAQPFILGALLNAVAHGLRMLPTIEIATLPRMADFMEWILACEGKLPWPAGRFMRAYTRNREEALNGRLEADQFAIALRVLISSRPNWTGTATALLAALDTVAPSRGRRDRTWPVNVRTLGARLRRLVADLRQLGVDISFDRTQDTRRERLISISRVEER